MFSFHHFDLLNSAVFFSSLVFLCFLGKILNKILFISDAFVFLRRDTRCSSWKERTILDSRREIPWWCFAITFDSLRTCLRHLRYFVFVVYRLHASSNIHKSFVFVFFISLIFDWRETGKQEKAFTLFY